MRGQHSHGAIRKTGRRVWHDKEDPSCTEYVITVNNTGGCSGPAAERSSLLYNLSENAI
jgi:hypothetical protein